MGLFKTRTIWHKLFECPTFWYSFFRKRSRYNCPRCKKVLRCYWDGNDIKGHGIDYCNSCTIIIERIEMTRKI